ncbi:MAG: hypothetical protein JJ974_03305 [Phycisphaerales bacterium]|nr:hypothetical protein [Phycisphaerales bacterium]
MHEYILKFAGTATGQQGEADTTMSFLELSQALSPFLSLLAILIAAIITYRMTLKSQQARIHEDQMIKIRETYSQFLVELEQYYTFYLRQISAILFSLDDDEDFKVDRAEFSSRKLSISVRIWQCKICTSNPVLHKTLAAANDFVVNCVLPSQDDIERNGLEYYKQKADATTTQFRDAVAQLSEGVIQQTKIL